MPGCWVREDHAWEWKNEVSGAEPQVDVAENPVVNVLLGPDGEVVASLLAREPIGFRQRTR